MRVKQIGKMEFEISFENPKLRIPFFECVSNNWKRKMETETKRKTKEEVRISFSNLVEIENK
jgi:hypothetical protein